MKSIFLIFTIFSLSLSAAQNAELFQFDLAGGLAFADSDNAEGFPASASFAKFQGVTTTGSYWRWTGAFGAVLGSGNTTAGEFALGGAFYPFSVFSMLPIQPFLGGSGVMVTASIDGTSKMLYGYAINSGIDLRIKRFGLKLGVDYVTTTFSSFRYYGGISIYFAMKRR